MAVPVAGSDVERLSGMTCVPVLPGSLDEALRELERDELVRRALGEHIYERFVEAKTIEWNEYRTTVSRWEVERYLDQF